MFGDFRIIKRPESKLRSGLFIALKYNYLGNNGLRGFIFILTTPFLPFSP